MRVVAEEPHRQSPAKGSFEWEFGKKVGGTEWVIIKMDFLIKGLQQTTDYSG
jgi:hypothetical protein